MSISCLIDEFFKCIKHRVLVLVSLAVVALAVVALALIVYTGFPSGSRYTGSGTQEVQNTVSVNGTATIRVTPDVANISFGVQTQDISSKKAQTENATLMASVTEALKQAGISDEDMQTSGYSIYPQYSYSDNIDQNKVTGYQVSNSVNVTVKDLSDLGAIIDAASNAGSNVVGGVTFTLSNPEDVYNQALEQALTKAKDKADVIAENLDLKLGDPSSVTEGSSYQQYYSTYKSYDMAVSAETTPISIGTVEVTAQVSVSYSY